MIPTLRDFSLNGHRLRIKNKGTISGLQEWVPRFTKAPFEIEGEGKHPHLYRIARECLNEHQRRPAPTNDDTVRMPIGIVSDKYELVQHHEILAALETVLNKKCGIDTERLEAHVLLTRYGERMWFRMTLPVQSFNPSVHTYFNPVDGHPVVLQVYVLNSVDTTASLEIKIVWERLICSNGMIFGEEIDFKKIHRKEHLSINAIESFFQKQFKKEQFEKEQERFRRWFAERVIVQRLTEAQPRQGQIEKWFEKHVSTKWNVHAAARSYNIAKTGYDGKFYNETGRERVKYDELTLNSKSVKKVPGAFVPVRNAYDISQVLSWIATQQPALQKQLKMLVEIPILMQTLLKMEPLTLHIKEQMPYRSGI